MDSVIRNFRHPVAIYYNRDGSLAFIRFMCFQCTVKSDYEYTWRYSGRSVKDLVQPDTLYYSELTRLPLVTLPDINDASLFSYVDISAKQFYAKPQYFLSSSYGGGTLLYNVSSISRLYTDGEVISQAFQVLGCFEPVRDLKLKTRTTFRSECGRSGEPRLIIFDHTLKRSYITLNILMRLNGRINVGNIDLETSTIPERYCRSCPISLTQVTSIKARDGLSVYSSGLQQSTGFQETELVIESSYDNEFLAVPENVRRLIVRQGYQSSKLKGITCPSLMSRCFVQVYSLEQFVAPRTCVEFSLTTYTGSIPYTKNLLPEVLKPMGSENKSTFDIWNVDNISHNFMTYQGLQDVRMHGCSFTSDTEELVLPVAADKSEYKSIKIAPHITTVRLVKNISLIEALPKDVEIEFSDLDRSITVVVDCDINRLSITGCTANIDACLTVTGKGRIRNGAVYNSNKVEILNNWGALAVGSGCAVNREYIAIKGCVKTLSLMSHKENNWHWQRYSQEAVLKLNEEKHYARDVVISMVPGSHAVIKSKLSRQLIRVLEKTSSFMLSLA